MKRMRKDRATREKEEAAQKKLMLEKWVPKTIIGQKVKNGEIKNIKELIDKGQGILEPQIVDLLLPTLSSELLLIGQSKGKFGGGQRRVFKQTQKKTKEGNKPSFATYAVVGDKNGYVGVGYGKSKETVPAREKAFRKAKLNLFKITRGCGSWQCNCKQPHSIPFEVHGKCGSVRLTLMPAPKGKGLVMEKECAKILAMAGITDVWSKTHGQTKQKMNFIKACEQALKKLVSTKVRSKDKDVLGIVEGAIEKKVE